MLTQRVDLFDSTYGHFTEPAKVTPFDGVCRKGLGRFRPEDQQCSRRSAARRSARTSARTAGENGVAEATRAVFDSHLSHQLSFRVADAMAPLPFANATFDALVCIDSMNHFPDRLRVFQEWQRVLRPGSRAVFTDPVVITRPVTNDDLALRSSIGLFVFTPPGVNESFIETAGFNLLRKEDATMNAAVVAGRWQRARHRHRDALLRIEGEERFEGLQKFFGAVHRLTSERRLSRIAYLVEKPTD